MTSQGREAAWRHGQGQDQLQHLPQTAQGAQTRGFPWGPGRARQNPGSRQPHDPPEATTLRWKEILVSKSLV